MGKFVSDPAIFLPGKRFTHMICGCSDSDVVVRIVILKKHIVSFLS